MHPYEIAQLLLSITQVLLTVGTLYLTWKMMHASNNEK